jgi:hypothetical protein
MEGGGGCQPFFRILSMHRRVELGRELSRCRIFSSLAFVTQCTTKLLRGQKLITNNSDHFFLWENSTRMDPSWTQKTVPVVLEEWNNIDFRYCVMSVHALSFCLRIKVMIWRFVVLQRPLRGWSTMSHSFRCRKLTRQLPLLEPIQLSQHTCLIRALVSN